MRVSAGSFRGCFANWLWGAGVLVVLAGWYGLRLVWPPDIWSGRSRVIEECVLPSGQRLALVQYWGPDFYTIELLHVTTGGRVMCSVVLDGDAPRAWGGALNWCERQGIVQVQAGSIRGVYQPVERAFTRSDGVVFTAGQPTREYAEEFSAGGGSF